MSRKITQTPFSAYKMTVKPVVEESLSEYTQLLYIVEMYRSGLIGVYSLMEKRHEQFLENQIKEWLRAEFSTMTEV